MKSELKSELKSDFALAQVDVSKYNGDMTFADKEDPEKIVQPYTFQKKLYLAATDLAILPPDGTALGITTQHRRIGKTKFLEWLEKNGPPNESK